MRILVVGAGGVGGALVPIAKRRSFFEAVVVADYDRDRAGKVVDRADDPRFRAAQVNASDTKALRGLIEAERVTHVLNAVDPRFVMPIFDAAFETGATYLDMTMSLSRPTPARPRPRAGGRP